MIKQWDRKFGGDYGEIFYNIKQTNDGGYALFGYSESPISGEVSQTPRGSADYWLVRTDSDGNKLWDKRFGGADIDVGIAFEQTTDNGYILGGYSISDTSIDKSALPKGYVDFWVVKTDSSGTKLWDKCYGGLPLASFVLRDLKQTSDGGYILGGNTANGIGGDCSYANWDTSLLSNDYWIIKIDAFGNKLWDRKFGGTGNDEFTVVEVCLDGGFLLGGSSWSDAGGDKTQPSRGVTDAWIVKTDPNGNKLWDKRYGGDQSEYLYSIKPTADGGFLLGVESNSSVNGDKSVPSNGFADYWMLKIDSLGNKIWDNGYGGNGMEEMSSITTDGLGNIYLCGDSYSQASGDKSENNLGVEQSWVVKTDFAGNLLWEKTIRTYGHDERTQIVIGEEGCVTVANFSDGVVGALNSQPPRGSVDFWMVKLCDSTAVTGNSESILTNETWQMYPNPAHDFVTIELPLGAKIMEMEILDVTGRIVKTESYSGTNVVVDINTFSPGLYFIQCIADGKVVLPIKRFLIH